MLLSWSAKNPIVRDGLNVLSKYGTDAHAWIPGLGYINGLSASNYLDSAGTTAASVDGLIGRMNDAAQTLGAELVTKGDFSSATGWTLAGTWSIGSGVASHTASAGADNIQQVGILTVGRTYQMTLDIVSITGTLTVYCGVGATQTFTTAGSKTVTLVCTTNTSAIYQAAIGTNCVIDNISVREVIGIHATQATAGNKPTLRFAGGKYYAEFGGDDYLSLSAVPFLFADNHSFFACVKATGAGNKTIFSSHPTGAGVSRLMCVMNATGQVVVTYTDDAGVSVAVTSPLTYLNTNIVISFTKATNAISLRINGAEVATGSTAALGTTTLAISSLGAALSTPANFMNGIIYDWTAIKGTLSAADVLTEEKYCGLFGGVAI